MIALHHYKVAPLRHALHFQADGLITRRPRALPATRGHRADAVGQRSRTFVPLPGGSYESLLYHRCGGGGALSFGLSRFPLTGARKRAQGVAPQPSSALH